MTEPAAILTIEAASPGGVPALVDVVYRLMENRGWFPVVYRAQFAEGMLSPWQRLLMTLRNRRPHPVEERGLRTVLVPAPPLPLWLFYLVPHFLIGPLLADYRAVFVASGSAHVALPLALRGIPYILWVATLYEDELRAKAAVGDAWAQRVLTGPTWPLLQAQERLALSRATRILALSDYTARRIKALLPQIGERLETVLYPVDTTRYRPDPQALAHSPYGDYLLLAARINDPRKNTPLLLRAFAQVLLHRPNLKLVLVGEPPNETLHQLVHELGLSDSVVFRGVVSQDELVRLYQGAHLFVLPAVQEGLGIVVLESLACGTPVVATRCGGPEELVIDGQTGRLVSDFHDPTEMAAAILDLLNDPSELQAMRQRCAALAAERFAFPIVASRLQHAFDLMSTPPPTSRPWAEALAAIWAVLIFAAYMQHQMSIHWPSIQARILIPLLSTLR